MKNVNQVAKGLMIVLLASSGVSFAEKPVQATPNYALERAERAKTLTEPYGWFSLVALEWLKPGVTTIGSGKDNSVLLAGAPSHLMRLEQKDGKVTLLKWAPSMTWHGQPLEEGGNPVVDKAENNASAMAIGTLRLWAIDRGGQRYLRVKDSNAPALKLFHGLRWYAPDEHYRVQARWIPYNTPHTMQVRNKLGQITPESEPGYVEFELNGEKHTLVPMEASEDRLWFVFRDKTSLRTTDGGGRFLTTNGPSNGLRNAGTVILDFNEAVNPPCAYSSFATCPLASPENRLAISVPAGEKRYEDIAQ